MLNEFGSDKSLKIASDWERMKEGCFFSKKNVKTSSHSNKMPTSTEKQNYNNNVCCCNF